MIVCKPCLKNKFEEWKLPFDPNLEELQEIPKYNEFVQHINTYSVEEVASKLNNGEMIEILCNVCKRTHVGKDENGNIMVKYPGKNWENYQQ